MVEQLQKVMDIIKYEYDETIDVFYAWFIGIVDTFTC